MRRRKPVTCGHHWRQNRGNGMCEECYQKHYYSKTKDSKEKLAQEKHIACPDKRRDKAFRFKYGIGLAEVNEMVAKQGGKCFICKRESKDLQLDHDHDTGIVRKMLCSRCNYGLGMFSDSPATLRIAADYIEEHKPSKTTPISGSFISTLDLSK